MSFQKVLIGAAVFAGLGIWAYWFLYNYTSGNFKRGRLPKNYREAL